MLSGCYGGHAYPALQCIYRALDHDANSTVADVDSASIISPNSTSHAKQPQHQPAQTLK
jgi:hypothetical protein